MLKVSGSKPSVHFTNAALRKVVFTINLLIGLSLHLSVNLSTALAQGSIAPLPEVDGEMAGSINGKFEVSAGGAATYNIPISVPPGTAGMSPNLSLSYDSGGGGGPIGPGWSLSGLSAITRCAMTLAQDNAVQGVDFNPDDRFCVDGQRLVSVQGTYGSPGTEYRTENQSFSKIVSTGSAGTGPQSFTVHQKNGWIYEYGTSADSRVMAQSQPSVLSWLLTRVRDRRGNTMSITYAQDIQLGENRPIRIDYTSNPTAGLAAYNSVRFEYEDAEAVVRYLAGSKFTNRFRLRKIQTYTESQLAWEYRLDYQRENVSQQDRLTRVTECDAENNCLPSSTFEWGSEEPNSRNFEVNSPLNMSDLSPAQGASTNVYYPVAAGDWDGDGKTDIARMLPSGWKFYVSRPGGPQLYTTLPTPVQMWNRGGQVYVGDWNGDGKSDLLARYDFEFPGGAYPAFRQYYGYYVYLSTGNGFTRIYDTGTPNFTLGSVYVMSEQMIILPGDYDGDGKTEIASVGLMVSGSTLPLTLRTYQFTEQGLIPTLPPFILAPSAATGQLSASSVNPYITGDWNGDGRTDIAYIDASRIRIFQSTPSGFVELAPFTGDLTPAQGYSDQDIYPIVTGDWNGDGLTDIGRVHQTGLLLYASNGTGFVPFGSLADFGRAAYPNFNSNPLFTGDWNSDGTTDLGRVTNAGVRFYTLKGGVASAPVDLADFGINAGYSNQNTYPLLVGDWNGDGKSDVRRVHSGGVIAYTHVQSRTTLVTKITDGFGLETRITYAPLTDTSVYSKGSGATYPQADIQAPLAVVASVSVSNGLNGFSGSHYHYVGLRAYLNGRGLSGFERVDISDDQTGAITSTTYRQDHPFRGLAINREQRLANGTLVSSTADTWAVKNFSDGTYFPYVSQSISSSYELDGAFIKSIAKVSEFDDLGNSTSTISTYSDGSSETTTNTFASDASSWLLGQLRRSEVTKATGNPNDPAITRTISFEYFPDTGLLRSETVEPQNSTLEVTKTYSYDPYGNIRQTVTSGAGFESRTDTSVFDSRGRFPVQKTNALNQSEYQEYDPRFGTITHRTDANGIESSAAYDGFGRVTLETRGDGTLTRTLYMQASLNALANAAYQVRVDSSGAPAVITSFDALGREIRRDSQGMAGARILVDRVYDERGNLTHVSEPYFHTGAPLWTVTEFDLLGRAKRMILPGNRQTTVTYNGLVSTTVNPLQQATTRTVDVQGRLLSVRDARNSTVNYVYDAYGNTTRVTDPAGNTIVTRYDLRGRKIEVTDPDSGVTSYQYDAVGQLQSQTDARGQTVQYLYDKLGRTIRRNSPEGTETWQYDSGSNAIGKLSKVVGLNGYQEDLAYDSRGRLAQQTKKIMGRTYTTTQRYDPYGRPEILTYPSSFAVKNTYDATGYLTRVSNSKTNQTYWTASSVNARGQFERQTLGNGVVVQKTFDSITGFVQRIQAGTVQDLRFQFDELANLRQRRDARLGLTEDFTYDNLNRLIRSQVVGQEAVDNTYDALGNILTSSEVGTYTYGENGAGPHAVTSITGPRANQYAYDAAGNRISSVDGTVTFSSAGRPVSIVNRGTEVTFQLDPSGDRVSETTLQSGVVTEKKVFGSPVYQYIESGTAKKEVHYISGGDGVIAVYTTENKSKLTVTARDRALSVSVLSSMRLDSVRELDRIDAAAQLNGTLRYLLTDHLGSIQTILDENANITELESFDSWGRRRNPTTWSTVSRIIPSSIDRGFTGHEQLDSVALIHMNGRVYDPAIGRFISADPYVQTADNLQSLNRYSYVNNNPLSFTDPTGFFLRGLFRSIGRFLQRALPIVASIVVAAVVGPWVSTLVSQTAFFATLSCTTATAGLSGALIAGISGVGAGISSSFVGALVSGASPSQAFHAALKGAPMSGLRAIGAFEIGELGANRLFRENFGNYALGARAVAHGVVGGALGTLDGGKFGPNFMGSFAAGLTENSGNLMTTALAGGTASALSGGKFEEGAMRAAFVYLYNACQHGKGCFTTQEEWAALNCNGYAAYYKRACDSGDSYACFAGKIAANEGFWAHRTTDRLVGFLEGPGANLRGGSISDVLGRIREDLAFGYAAYLPSSEGSARWPTARGIAELHWNVFGHFGVPAKAFGGTPLGENGGIWFDKHIVGWCPDCR